MNMQWACKECNMPLCIIAGQGKEWACYNKHKRSNNEHDGCHRSVSTRSFIVPVENDRTSKEGWGGKARQPKTQECKGEERGGEGEGAIRRGRGRRC
jgi:hypothetical protein